MDAEKITMTIQPISNGFVSHVEVLRKSYPMSGLSPRIFHATLAEAAASVFAIVTDPAALAKIVMHEDELI